MRLAFCGKGGSGKTTVTSLFAKYLASRHLSVLAMDGDINQHLGEMLGLSASALDHLPKLGNEIERLQKYIKGSNPRIEAPQHIIKTAPPGRGSGFFYFDRPNEINKRYEKQIGGIRFMAVGGFTEEKLGTTCFHSYSAAMNMYLNHLIDQDDEYFLGDLSAGADPFTTGLITRFDIAFLVMEPTTKSASVFEQCKEYAEPFGVQIRVIGNKVEKEDDLEFIQNVAGEALIATLWRSNFVRDFEKGIIRPLDELEPGNTSALHEMFNIIKTCTRDWERQRLNNLEFHKRAADNWASAVYETDLNKQIDPDFTYDQLLTAKAL